MRLRLAFLLSVMLAFNASADWFTADPEQTQSGVELLVADPYIELRTGPGRGYPIFHIVERGQPIRLLKRKTDYYRIEGPRGKQGWVSVEQLNQTLSQDGEPIALDRGSLAGHARRDWETGVWLGDFGGATLIGAHLGYAFNGYLSTELHAAQALGDVSDSTMVDLSVLSTPFPEWVITPYVGLGAGVLITDPHAAVAQSPSRNNETLIAVAGLRYYVTRQFLLRAEYRNTAVLTDRNENENINVWKLGLNVYF